MALQKKLLAVAIPVLSTGVSLNAIAQPQPTELDEIVVSASGSEQKITDAPASISVVNQEALQRNQYSNLAEALETVEGVDVRQSTGKTSFYTSGPLIKATGSPLLVNVQRSRTG